MMRNLLVLALLTWLSTTYAKKDHVVHDSMSEAESFKVQDAVEEQEAKRSVAGGKIKKTKKSDDEESRSSEEEESTESSDSEVRYWQYSE